MSKKQTRRIKLSKNLKPFVSRVNTNGAIQRAFGKQIGEPAGACVASTVTKGMSGKEIHDIAKDCSSFAKGKTLVNPDTGNPFPKKRG